METDHRLLSLIARGDSGAVARMVGRKLPRLLALAGRLLRDRGEAEDVAQEAFVRIWKIAPLWQQREAKFDTWLHAVALNLCRDRVRRRREVPTDRLPERVDPRPGAEAALLEADEQRAVRDAVAALPERQREAIVLQYYQELSNRDAAEVMEISVDALESLLSRARRTLRQSLRSDGER